MRKIIVLILTLAFAGCANHPVDCALDIGSHNDCLPGTAGYDSAQKRQEQAEAQKRRQQEADDATCKSYGLTFGTSDYAQCREKLLEIHVNQSIAANNTRAQQNAAIAGLMTQQANKPAPAPYMMPTNQPITTNCTTVGSSTNCQSQ